MYIHYIPKPYIYVAYKRLYNAIVLNHKTKTLAQAMAEELITKLKYNIKVYPNPTEDKVTIDIISETNDLVTLNIYDLNNRVVYTQKNIALTSGLETIDLNLDLQSGLYTLKIQGQTTNYIEKLIIQ